jgi:excinuclease UvrABC ATPase subunit
MSNTPSIVVQRARTHNLKGINCRIPHRAVTVVTGPSGAGKSSLAFDTVFAEGQRRFVESMSTYARQFLDQMERPPVDAIENVLPAVALEAKNAVRMRGCAFLLGNEEDRLAGRPDAPEVLGVERQQPVRA